MKKEIIPEYTEQKEIIESKITDETTEIIKHETKSKVEASASFLSEEKKQSEESDDEDQDIEYRMINKLMEHFSPNKHNSDELWYDFNTLSTEGKNNINIYLIVQEQKKTSLEDYIKIQKAYFWLKKASRKTNNMNDNIHYVHLLKTKIRTIFVLRNINCPLSVLLLIFLLDKEDHTNILVKHEIGYVIGQMRQPISIPFLFKHLLDSNQDSITRHECAEALGNFSIYDINMYYGGGVGVLENLIKNPIDIISESCYLAFKKLQSNSNKYVDIITAMRTNIDMNTYIKQYEDTIAVIENSLSPFNSFDPSFPADKYDDMFLDDNGDLYARYKIMFYLRNLNNAYSIEKLCKGFKCKSKLFRHEIAFVMGQMQNPDTLKILEEVIMNEEEEDIVRHEALESIGSIGGDKADEILKKFVKHEVKILRDSAVVGLDILSGGDS
ncbi:Deoxyhypusine hydroxylase [Cucumispora dikerogammari]|nr:Deoxyhypusine hydroxylase [Cucumispora dikerogammari]